MSGVGPAGAEQTESGKGNKKGKGKGKGGKGKGKGKGKKSEKGDQNDSTAGAGTGDGFAVISAGNVVYRETNVGPFVLKGFDDLRGLWAGCEPVYDANARSLRVYGASDVPGAKGKADKLLKKLKRELSLETMDLVLQTGTVEATFADGLKVDKLARPSCSTLKQIVLSQHMIPMGVEPTRKMLEARGFTRIQCEERKKGSACILTSFSTSTIDEAAGRRMEYADDIVAPSPQFRVKVTGTQVNAGWDGTPCYVWLCLCARGEQAVRDWAGIQSPPLRVEVQGEGLGCLLPTSAQAKALAGVYNQHAKTDATVEFGFDDPSHADLLVKYAGAVAYMHSQVCTDYLKEIVDPLGAARKIADAATRKFNLAAFTIGEPSKNKKAACLLSSGAAGGATQCSKAFVYATDKWQDNRLLANRRFTRLLIQTLIETKRLKAIADAAKVRVAEPKKGTELPLYLGVKGSDQAFGQLLYLFGLEQDALLLRSAVCSVTPSLAAQLRTGWLAEQQKDSNAYIVVENDAVFVTASTQDSCNRIVNTLNKHRAASRLSTDDRVTCVCKALSATRLTRCGHIVCDDCMVNTAPKCPYPDCDENLCPADLRSNGRPRKDLAERLICTALENENLSAKFAFGVCPTATCTAIIPKKKMMSLCTKCAVSVCCSCKVSDARHKGKSCKAYIEYLEAFAPCPSADCTEELPLKEGAQRCPTCNKSVCAACGLLDADWKGHHTSCSEYYTTIKRSPLLRLYKEAQQFASNHLKENGYATYRFRPNECVRKLGCGALDKFMKAVQANDMDDEVLAGRMGHFGWHGTRTTAAVSAICCDGWDATRRHGQVYGTGEYFAYQAATSLGSYSGDTKMLIVAFILQGNWLNKTTHLVVNNPCDNSLSYVVPVGVVYFDVGDFPKQICTGGCAPAEKPLTALWEWQDMDGTWRQYSDVDCRAIEKASAKYRKRPTQNTMQIRPVQLSTDVPATYEIDFTTMEQTNLSSGLGGVRQVRRTDRSSATSYGMSYESSPGVMTLFDTSVQDTLHAAVIGYVAGGSSTVTVRLPTRPERYEIDFLAQHQKNLQSGERKRVHFGTDHTAVAGFARQAALAAATSAAQAAPRARAQAALAQAAPRAAPRAVPSAGVNANPPPQLPSLSAPSGAPPQQKTNSGCIIA